MSISEAKKAIREGRFYPRDENVTIEEHVRKLAVNMDFLLPEAQRYKVNFLTFEFLNPSSPKKSQ